MNDSQSLTGAASETKPAADLPRSPAWLELLGFFGPFFALATLAAFCVTFAEANAQGWAALGREWVFGLTLAQEIGHAWRVMLVAALPAAIWLGFGRRANRVRIVWAAAWMAIWLPLVSGVLRDWRVARRRYGWDVPQILWQRERLVPALVIAAVLLVLAVALTLILRRGGRGKLSLGWPRARAALLPLALLIWGGSAWIGARGLAQGSAAQARRHPVIYLTWDSTRADHVSAYGYERETTPRLSELAAEGVLFERAYSQHSWTRPSYAATLSSQPQWGRGESGLADFHWTLAEELKAAGYHTRALVQNPNVSGFYGFAQGFDRFVEYRGHVEDVAGRAREWLQELARDYQAGGPPFFLFVHCNEPHWPYRHEQALASGFTTLTEPPIEEELISILMKRRDPVLSKRPVSPLELEYMFAAYDAEILAADTGLGSVLDTLQASGLSDEVLVVFNSDHGDEFLERSEFGHGQANVYPELTRIPLIMRFPGQALSQQSQPLDGLRGATFEQPVENIDLYPTVLGALDIPAPPGLEGRNLYPRLVAGPDAEPEAEVFLARSYNTTRLALRGLHYAMQLNTELDSAQFYALDGDLAELVPTPAELAAPWAAELSAAGQVWKLEQLERRRGQLSRSGPEEELDEDLMQELRRLGYL